MTKILLHACCAVCAGYPLEFLTSLGYEPVIYFYNPNIHPEAEYTRRLNELLNYSDKKGFECITGDEDPFDWFEFTKEYRDEPERGKRCQKCFELRLMKTAELAHEKCIKKFTTTLLISPHKIRNDIVAEGNKVASKYDLEFCDFDFRKNDGYLKTMLIAKAENFYRQTYCGCIYAMRQ